MSDTKNQDILLESGTNELEMIVFGIGYGWFGINVLKVREIINPLPVVEVPNSHEYIEGIISLRGEVLPVVNLAKVLNDQAQVTSKQDKLVVVELNELKIAFRVHEIARIYRFSWEEIEKPDGLSTSQQTYAIGYTMIEDDIIILLDFEKVIVEINPQLSVASDANLRQLGKRERSEKKLIVAEDSAVLRHMLQETLEKAGYYNITFFENGREAWEYLMHIASNESIDLSEEVHLMITDIEMPQMDGHHLIANIRNHSRLKHIPVVIFSSLITDALYHKGEEVGADAQVTKPQIANLIKEIDKCIL